MKFFVLFLSLLMSHSAFAKHNVHSDFHFILKPSEFAKFVEKQVNSSVSESMDDITIEEPFYTEARGIRMSANLVYDLKYTPNSESHLNFEAKVSDLVIEVDSVETDDEIVTQVGNIQLRTKIQGRCEGLRANYPNASLTIAGTAFLSNNDQGLKVDIQITNFNLQSLWSLEVGDCRGFAEYQDEVSKALLELLNNKQEILNRLQPRLVEESQSQIDLMAAAVLKEQSSSFPGAGRVTFAPEVLSYDHASTSLVISGEVRSEFLETDEIKDFPYEIDEQVLSQTSSSGILLSKEFVQECSDHLFSHGVYKAGFESQKVDSIRKFQRSRFLQFFVFPEIMSHSKSANFIMNGYLTSAPQINYEAEKEGIIYLSTRGSANLDSFAPKPEGYVPFLNFLTNYSLTGWMKVENNSLNVGFFTPKMAVGHQWAPTYLAKHKVKKWFNKPLIVNEIKSLMKDTRFRFPLPQIEVEEGEVLHPVELREQSDHLHLVYQ